MPWVKELTKTLTGSGTALWTATITAAGGAPAAGNTLVMNVQASTGNNRWVTGVTDDRGNHWDVVKTTLGSVVEDSLCYTAQDAAPLQVGDRIFIAIASSTSTTLNCDIEEFAGFAGLRTSLTHPAAGSPPSPFDLGSVGVQVGDPIVTALTLAAGATGPTPPAGFTARGTQLATRRLADSVAPATGSQDIAWTYGGAPASASGTVLAFVPSGAVFTTLDLPTAHVTAEAPALAGNVDSVLDLPAAHVTAVAPLGSLQSAIGTARRLWDGSAWVLAIRRLWDGSSWV